MKGNWPDAEKSSAKTGGAVKAEGCKPNQQSKDYGMTIQQQYQQTKVLTGPLNGSNAITMTSLDFLNNIINPARVEAGENPVENRHFIARIEDEIDDLGGAEKFYATTSQGAKREVKGYALNFDQMMLIGMRESKAVRRSVLAKLKALDEQVRAPQVDPMVALNDPATMRGLLLSYSERVMGLEHKVEEMQSDVDALERIAKADGSMCITDAAKHLQVQPNYLFKLLSSKRWIYKRSGGKVWIAYQDKLQSGVLEHKITTVIRPDGSEKVTERALVTAKGIAVISKMLSVAGVAA
ncbi:phage antirepressor KilAC domain-containing protein [Aeromonas salmonicida]|uniref:phage antirepressor KilAC domain-containing protein n=2 Tax=Aeromonas salmonicida TaxID=645 RepID=UPI0013A6F9A5|nr:phage antirepressor KilAC domain-containing protein [Aeromonas salmonicida]